MVIMVIIISKNGINAKKIEKSSFEKEDYLQKYIYENPESIPLYDVKENTQLLVLCREFSTNSGPIDALGIDREGNIYLVETKLYKNPDKRLVVAQALDYGASLWKSYKFEDFINQINSFLYKKLKVSINQRIKDFFHLGDEEVNNVIENIGSNLREGSFKFVVLMDKLHQQLKDLIIYLNQNSEFDIFAVELEYYKYEDYEIMIPRLFGSEIKKDINVSLGARKKWDEQSFFEDAKNKLNDKQLEAVRKLYDFSKQKADDIFFGTGVSLGSFNPKFYNVSVRSLYSVYSDGKLSINIGWLNDNEKTIERRNEFLKELEKIKELEIPENSKELPSLPIPIDKWYLIVDDFIKTVQSILIK